MWCVVWGGSKPKIILWCVAYSKKFMQFLFVLYQYQFSSDLVVSTKWRNHSKNLGPLIPPLLSVRVALMSNCAPFHNLPTIRLVPYMKNGIWTIQYRCTSRKQPFISLKLNLPVSFGACCLNAGFIRVIFSGCFNRMFWLSNRYVSMIICKTWIPVISRTSVFKQKKLFSHLPYLKCLCKEETKVVLDASLAIYSVASLQEVSFGIHKTLC